MRDLDPSIWPNAPALPKQVAEWLETVSAVLKQRIGAQIDNMIDEAARVLTLQAEAARLELDKYREAYKKVATDLAMFKSDPDTAYNQARSQYVALLLQYRALADKYGEPHNVATLPAPAPAPAPSPAAASSPPPPPPPPPKKPNRRDRRRQAQQERRKK